MTRNLLNTINIDVPAAVADETVAFWSAALGATVVELQWKDHPGSWVVLRDPAGNEFCLVDGRNPVRGPEVLDDFERRARDVG
jgi:catechol 2,3-dioxygenase-like lactoylglutathione lyase family enzyme